MLFFSKHHYIVDHLEGLIDMHCHLLPYIDDGAKDYEMAKEMLDLYTDLGFVGAIATPHIMEGYYDNTASKVTQRYDSFKSHLAEHNLNDFRLSLAAEYMMDSGFDVLLEKKEFLPVTGNQVLVETSFLRPSLRVFDQLFHLRQHGFEPILAHPERYSYLLSVAEVLAYKNQGCKLQLNLLSLGNHYGTKARKQAFDLLEGRHYEYLGTDAHHPGHLRILKKITIKQKTLSHFQRLLESTLENLSS